MRFHLLLRAVSHASACLSRRAHLPHASPRGGRRRRSTADSCWCATPRVSAEPEFMEAESEGEEEDERYYSKSSVKMTPCAHTVDTK